MKWKIGTDPQIGETRTKTKFLLLPAIAGDEIRWLERVRIEQIGTIKYSANGPYRDWMNERFIDARSSR